MKPRALRGRLDAGSSTGIPAWVYAGVTPAVAIDTQTDAHCRKTSGRTDGDGSQVTGVAELQNQRRPTSNGIGQRTTSSLHGRVFCLYELCTHQTVHVGCYPKPPVVSRTVHGEDHRRVPTRRRQLLSKTNFRDRGLSHDAWRKRAGLNKPADGRDAEDTQQYHHHDQLDDGEPSVPEATPDTAPKSEAPT